MKKTVFALIMGFALTFNSCKNENQKLIFDNNLSFVVKKNENFLFDINIINNNDSDLHITSIQTSCNCLESEKMKILKPNSQTKLKFAYHSNEIGNHIEKILFRTDEENEFKFVIVKFDVK